MYRGMGGTAMNLIGISGFLTEQIILQKNNMDSNKDEPMTELGLSLGSGYQGIPKGSDNNSSAGANAGSIAEIMLVTEHTLSELVWSPHKGLSLKCAECSSVDKKPFLLCGMGSGCVVLPPPQIIEDRGTTGYEPVAEGNSNSLHMAPHVVSETSERINFVTSPTRTISLMPVSQMTSHEDNEGSSGGMKELTSITEQPALDINAEDIIPNLSEKDSAKGPDNGRTADSSSIKVDEPKLDLGLVEPECRDFNKRTSSVFFKNNRDSDIGNNHAAGMDGVLASEVSTIKQYKLHGAPTPILTSWDRKHEGLASVIEEDGKNRMTSIGFTNIPLLEKHESTSENDTQILKVESACLEVGMIVPSQPGDEEVKLRTRQTEEILPRDGLVSVEASPNKSIIPSNQREDKETKLSNAKVNVKTLKAQDDNHWSVESSNNMELFSIGKRPWSFEKKLTIGNKKMKKQKQNHESPLSASFHIQASSFMNWISNMVKGLSKSNLDEAPSSALTIRPNHENGSHNQLFMLHGKNQESGCTSMGFESIFKALYCPITSVPNKEILLLDHHPSEGLKELELANKTRDNSSTRIACGNGNNKLFEEIIIPNDEFNEGASEGGEGPSALPNFASANISVLQENRKTSNAEDNNSCNIAFDLEKGGVISPDYYFQNDSDSPSERKEAYEFSSIDPRKPLNSVTNRRYPGSLWMTRFSQKVSGLVIKSLQCNQNGDADVEGSTECSKLVSQSQDCVVSVKDQDLFGDGREPFTDDRMDIESKKVPNYLVNSTGYFGSKRNVGYFDQKFKSKLNPIKPSQRFKNSEAMASVFAKRLDALKHIIPSEIDGNENHATMNCCFCGISGHKLRDCSEITESEIEDVLKKINLYDGAKEMSCLCIHCFQLNHWAIACPNKSLKRRSHSNGSSLVNFRSFGKMLHVPGHDNTANNDEKNLPVNKDCGCQVTYTICDGEKPRADTELTVGTNTNENMGGRVIIGGRVPDLKPTKKVLLGSDFCVGDTSREFVPNGNQTVSSFMEDELKENWNTAFCHLVNLQIPAVPRGTFEVIKQLRLSRIDILKWMKSPVSLFCLEGFFLRVRFRKWEGFGGTSYYVACINGTSRERSSGNSKIPLSVDIGGFTCLIESHYVSNHDFIEDELMAWWCATLRSGAKLPSEEHLKMKLEERKNFGF